MSEIRGRLKAAWLWFGHYHAHIGIITALVGGAAMSLGAATGEAFWSYAGMSVYAVWFIGVFAQQPHMRTLCPRDAVDLAPMLDPEGAIERYRRELRTDHSLRWAAVPLVLFFGGAAAAVILKAFTGLGLEARLLVFAGMFFVSTVTSAYLTYAGLHHRRLRPWCPLCHRGGGGRGYGFQVPDPTSPAIPRPEAT